MAQVLGQVLGVLQVPEVLQVLVLKVRLVLELQVLQVLMLQVLRLAPRSRSAHP